MVPRHAIALVARACYGENYLAVAMKHEIEHVDAKLKVEYFWRRNARKWESLTMTAAGEPQSIPAGSHLEFISALLKSSCIEKRSKWGWPQFINVVGQAQQESLFALSR